MPDECDTILGVKFSAPGGHNISVRHDLFPGASLLVDIGGNVGEDIKAYVQRFPASKIWVYEPVPEFYNSLKSQFGGNPHVRLNEFGVSDGKRTATFNVDAAATSGLDSTGKGQHIKVHLHDISSVLSEVQKAEGRSPDVVSVNCEGCEYAVLQRMANSGWLGKVPFIQMSWHIVDGVGKDRVYKRCEVERVLRLSHDPVYFCDFGWQGWKLRAL